MSRLLSHALVLALGVALGAGGAWLMKLEALEASSALRDGTVVSAAGGLATYRNARLGFSITYPETFAAQEFDEGNGATTVLFQKPGAREGFQLFIVPYAEDSISPERIKKDIPTGVVEEPTEVVIGDGIRATVFWSESPGVGRTREAWFIHEGYLYEATAYAAGDEVLGTALSTLDFK